jgi:glycosyltransferase involved in cell wall biosynthesis
LPVYEGENYLEQTIECLLQQTFEDFELIISDNGSTDRTSEIALRHAARDPRVRYYREPVNRGAAYNYRRTFELSLGKYFKWAAHDDLCLPTFIDECVRVLDNHPDVVLCFAHARTIDSNGRVIRNLPVEADLCDPNPRRRFRDAISDRECNAIFGLMRRDVLARTPLLGPYVSHDVVLLAELCLHGRFHALPNCLFLLRDHPQRSMRAFDIGRPQEMGEWFDPGLAGKLTFPRWRILAELFSATLRPPLHLSVRAACWRIILAWAKNHRLELLDDLAIAAARVPGIGRFFASARRALILRWWNVATRRFAKTISSVVPAGQQVLLLDDALLDTKLLGRVELRSFPETDGQYDGAPVDGGAVIEQLERQRREGAAFLAIAWTCFWWLDYYEGFQKFLELEFVCVAKRECGIIFDLRRRP